MTAQVLRFVQIVWERLGKDSIQEASAALSYYTLFSLAPLLVFTVAIGGLILDPSVVQGEIIHYFNTRFGVHDAIIAGMLENIFDMMTNIIFVIVGGAIMFVSVVNLINHVREVFFRIFSIEVKGKGVVRTLRQRLFSAGYTLILFVGILVVVVGMVVISFFFDLVGGLGLDLHPVVTDLLRIVIIFAVASILLYCLYTFMSMGFLSVRSAMVGAFSAAGIFVVVNIGISIYFTYTLQFSLYEALTSVVLLLFWVYLLSFIVFLGGEIAVIHAQKQGDVAKKVGV